MEAEAFRDTRSQGSYLFGPELLGPLFVTRRVFSSAEGPFLRYLDTFENISSKVVKDQVTLECEFAPKRWIEVEETSSGGSRWRVSDDHVHFNDRDPVGGMPYLSGFTVDPRLEWRPESVSLQKGIASITFPLDLEPGQRKAVLHSPRREEAWKRQSPWPDSLPRRPGSRRGAQPSRREGIINLALDRDGDGIPGIVEISFGLDPENPADAQLDPDGDLLTNLEEYQNSTDPHSPDTDGDGSPMEGK